MLLVGTELSTSDNMNNYKIPGYRFTPFNFVSEEKDLHK